jgi:hypothetical protein
VEEHPASGREGNVAWIGRRIGAVGEHIPESQREGRYCVELLDPGCDPKRADVELVSFDLAN